MEVVIRPTAEAASDLVARIIARQIRENPRAVMGLASGNTMESVYARLVQMHLEEGLDFSACRTFNLDEYVGLPVNHANSYRRYMNHHLFSRVNIDLRNTHLPDGMAADLASECANYERLIALHGGIGLQLLGIGQNGHLGFNEPLSAFRSRTRVTVLSRATRAQNAPLFSGPDQVPQRAITMGVGSILDCRRCILLATGSEKAPIVAKAVEGPITSMISATALQLHPHCILVLDEAAAGQLKETEYYSRVFEEEPECAAYRDVLFSAENGLHVVADSALDNELRPTREKVARLPLNGDEAG
ncbi:MAG TPA: glucosamine-6-phosphate deaminase [Verrucomicrobiae bacterium]|jgi:glucosamine-6-phosphate deaminase|nr:glucosamine-6-phosphate deaminase [Verrucomicrobiae bacterium]